MKQLNENNDICKLIFYIITAFMVLFSLSLVLMYFAWEQSLDGNNSLLYVAGAVFWVSLIADVVLVILLNLRRNRNLRSNSILQKKYKKQRPGILRVFSNKSAAIADMVFVAGFIGFIICIATSNSTEFIAHILLSIVVLSFSMHCMLNGKNYEYICQKNKEYAKP